MRRKILAMTLIMGILLSGSCLNYVSQVKTRTNEKLYNYIVMSDENQDVSSIAQDFEQVKDVGVNENVEVVKMTEQEARDLARGNCVIVEKDSELTASTKDSKLGKMNTEWNIKAIRANVKHEKEKAKVKQNKIKVAVVDSGIDDYNDIELAGSINLIPGEEEVPTMYQDVSGHGSSVAGIIAAQYNGEGISGIAPEAEIYSVKVLDGNNRATISRVINGIYWAIEKKVNIINMSFGTPTYSSALHQAIRDAKRAGILLIAAAGNGKELEYPAAYEEVMAVGSTSTNGDVSNNSATGKELEIVAPGEQICSTGAFGGTIIASGTSMSAPHVTGIAVKLWEKDSSMSADFIRQLIDASANKFTSSDKCGNGLVDYSYAEKIYDKFKSTYRDGVALEINEKSVDKNSSEVKRFNDVNYVEGRWKKADHEITISDAYKNHGDLTASEIAIVKKGVVAQDNSLKYNSDDSKTEKYKSLHGYNNYVNAYAYVMNMALKCEKSGLTEAKKNSYISNNANDISDCNNIKSAITKSVITTALNGTTYNKKNAALVLMGMACHIIGDSFSHRAYEKKGSSWKHIEHSTGNADKTSYVSERFKAAKYVIGEALDLWKANSYADFEEYNIADTYNFGSKFRLVSLSSYCSRVDKGKTYNICANDIKKLSCKSVGDGVGKAE